MSKETFTSAGQNYDMTVHPGPTDGKKHPVVIVLHGNRGLDAVFGPQIQDFAKELAGLHYVTAVPEYYPGNNPPQFDTDTARHVPTLAAAIAKVTSRADVDSTRLGLVGYSLGAATAMTYIASPASGTVAAKVLVDFFGPISPAIQAGAAHFPPTIIAHNKDDRVVEVTNSTTLDAALTSKGIVHEYDEYTENNEAQLNHPFKRGGSADVTSRAKAAAWLRKHIPPGGA